MDIGPREPTRILITTYYQERIQLSVSDYTVIINIVS